MSTTGDSEVICAIRESSLRKLQDLSLRPGGFGDARQQAWSFLLGVELQVISDLDAAPLNSRRNSAISESWSQTSSLSASTSLNGNMDASLDVSSANASDERVDIPSHPDEHQVQLDTNRSFILYPPVENRSMNQRKSLQEGLQDIILGVLRKRPRLRYFQGYHDIITVLFLTLPSGIVSPCAEKLSLHRVRDSMGKGLDPLVGQLRVLKRLLRLVDSTYAEVLERNSPLPYYALSNLLTLFSHDVPTLSLVQQVFDWLFCREPIAAIWLAAAVILRRKQDILALEREGEDAMGMMHAVLSALPALSEEPPNSNVSSEVIPTFSRECTAEKDSINLREKTSDPPGVEETPKDKSFPRDVSGLDTQDEYLPLSSDTTTTTTTGDDFHDGTRSPASDSLLGSWTADSPRAASLMVSIPDIVSASIPETVELFELKDARDVISDEPEFLECRDYQGTTPEVETRPRQVSSSSSSRSRSRSLPGAFKEKPPAPPLPLSVLLCEASELLVAYPPSSPALRVVETFGQQSALYPCSPSTGLFSDLSDDEAEACVGGDDVVLPPTQEDQDAEVGPPRKTKEYKRIPTPGARKGRGATGILRTIVLRRQTLVAGAVLIFGVAVALYGFGSGGRGAIRGGYGFGRFGDKRVVAWMGALLGVGKRLGIRIV